MFDDDDIFLSLFEQGHISSDIYINEPYHIDTDDVSIYDDGSGLYCGIND